MRNGIGSSHSPIASKKISTADDVVGCWVKTDAERNSSSEPLLSVPLLYSTAKVDVDIINRSMSNLIDEENAHVSHHYLFVVATEWILRNPKGPPFTFFGTVTLQKSHFSIFFSRMSPECPLSIFFLILQQTEVSKSPKGLLYNFTNFCAF